MSGNILEMSAGEIAAAIAKKTLSAVEVAEAALARIDEVNPAVNAVCTVNPGLKDEAAAVDRRIAAGWYIHSRREEGSAAAPKNISQHSVSQ